jgi:hypothetical protein
MKPLFIAFVFAFIASAAQAQTGQQDKPKCDNPAFQGIDCFGKTGQTTKNGGPSVNADRKDKNVRDEPHGTQLCGGGGITPCSTPEERSGASTTAKPTGGSKGTTGGAKKPKKCIPGPGEACLGT